MKTVIKVVSAVVCGVLRTPSFILYGDGAGYIERATCKLVGHNPEEKYPDWCNRCGNSAKND